MKECQSESTRAHTFRKLYCGVSSECGTYLNEQDDFVERMLIFLKMLVKKKMVCICPETLISLALVSNHFKRYTTLVAFNSSINPVTVVLRSNLTQDDDRLF